MIINTFENGIFPMRIVNVATNDDYGDHFLYDDELYLKETHTPRTPVTPASPAIMLDLSTRRST